NVVGYPLMPVYTAKAGGFFFTVFGVIVLMGALLTINPVWKFGPYDPTKVTAGSQPDWYMGWPDGLLRIIPAWESEIFGYLISWNILIPILLAPPLLLTIVALLPFVERWITGDKREHHLLQRPRDVPTRTAIMAALVTFYGIAWAAGGNDIIAIKLHLSINQITYGFRVLIFLAPIVVFTITKRWCISLQRHDEQKLLHGYETGVIMRSPEGGYTEKHLPISDKRAYVLNARDRGRPLEPADETDANGVRQRGHRLRALRSKLSQVMYADNVQAPTADELEELPSSEPAGSGGSGSPGVPHDSA
ncbi:MAG: ubiquinol-cytochrome c reductase cytochrome b subunit, partial [Actinomycetota bacterium]|nr:ubiquinol-cytochrome c reductase cytochrome b subunit [Actinomycetota bacterium]